MSRSMIVMAIVAAFGGLSRTAVAEPPAQFTDTVGPVVETFPSEEFPFSLCSFTYQIEWLETYRDQRFFDGEGNLVRRTGHFVELNKHRNLDTGVELQETIHLTAHIDPVTKVWTVTGNSWNLHTEDGRLVYVGSGRHVVHRPTGEVFETTPNDPADVAFEDIICPLLGGEPAAGE